MIDKIKDFVGQDKQAEMAFFDKFNDDTGYDSLTDLGYQTLINSFVRMANPTKGERVGDFGCGSAAFGRRVRESCEIELVGVDLSPELIKKNKEIWPEIEFHQADIENTKLEPNSFDLIMYSGVLHHFPDFRKVSVEAYRLLKPGGRIFSLDPHHFNPAMWVYRAKSSPIHSTKGRTINERLLTKKELRQVWGDAGFTKVQTISRSGVGISYLESKSLSLLLSAYNLFDNILFWSKLDYFIGSFVLTCAWKDSKE